MSILGRKISVRMVAALAVIMVLGALLPAMTTVPAREITLVVRGMTFYLEGDFENPNPDIAVKAGESVRIVVRNEERGMTHDFAVPAVGAGIGLLDWKEQGEVTFDVPATRGHLRVRLQAAQAHDERHTEGLLTLRATLSTPDGKRRYVRRSSQPSPTATTSSHGCFLTVRTAAGSTPGPPGGAHPCTIACSTSPAARATSCSAQRHAPKSAVGLDVTHRMLQLAKARDTHAVRPAPPANRWSLPRT